QQMHMLPRHRDLGVIGGAHSQLQECAARAADRCDEARLGHTGDPPPEALRVVRSEASGSQLRGWRREVFCQVGEPQEEQPAGETDRATGRARMSRTAMMTRASGNLRSSAFVRTPKGEIATLRRPMSAEAMQTRMRKTMTEATSQAGMSMFAYPMGSPMKWM